MMPLKRWRGSVVGVVSRNTGLSEGENPPRFFIFSYFFIAPKRCNKKNSSYLFEYTFIYVKMYVSRHFSLDAHLNRLI